ncbi:MAG: ribosome biogenesis GTP-binding protein YihA/YsxC [Pseudomonadota bacterium]
MDQKAPEEDQAGEFTAYSRWLFSQHCQFIMGVAKEEQLPASELPEVAFAGRSNVGKSSLLNTLVGRKQLARTSKTPGRTQQINFFDLAGQGFLVDLPGYGYAKASKSNITSWTRLIYRYLQGRVPLKRVFVLIDSRHGLKKVDREIFELLDSAAVPYQIVLTKRDKISSLQLEQLQSEIAKQLKPHPAAFPVVLSTSSFKKLGVGELREVVAELIPKHSG